MTQVHLGSNPPLDEFVLTDASLLVAGYVPTDSRHSLALSFLSHAASEITAGTCQLFATQLALEEVVHTIVRAGLRRDVGRDAYPAVRQQWETIEARRRGGGRVAAFGWEDLYKHWPDALSPYLPEARRVVESIRALPIEIVESDMLGITNAKLLDRMLDCMQTYRLLAADGYHIAVASALGATMLVTLDRDWLRADGDLTILID